MYRGGGIKKRTVYPGLQLTQEFESNACKIIQAQKDILLTSLAGYFAKATDKDVLKQSLREIKTTLIKDCPSYVPRSGCC
jgi:hypothetical protein